MYMAQSTDFSIEQVVADPASPTTLVLRPQGNIDITTAEVLKQAFQQAIQQGTRHLVINLARVPLVDSSGLTVFITALRDVKAVEGSLRISNVSSTVKFVFEITTLDTILQIYDTEEQALAA